MKRVLTCLVLTGCVHQPEVGWLRTDGKPVVPIQFEADEATCKGDLQKARLAATGNLGLLSRLQAQDDVYSGCMASKGYVQRNIK